MMRARLKRLTGNWRLKVFSLVVSVLLFLFVRVEYSTVVDVDYPIEYQTAEDIMLTSDANIKLPPSVLHATLKGPWATFRSFGDLEPVVIDLNNAEPGTLVRRIEAEDINSPAGMSVLAFRPSELELRLDRRVEKLVAVEVDPLGRPAFGFDIAELRADPSRVRVEGPLSKIRTLDFIQTRPVDLREKSEDTQMEVPLTPPSQPVALLDRTSVTVFVDIVEVEEERDLELKVRVDNAPEGADVSVDPETVRITLKGPRHRVGVLKQDAMTAVIDANPEYAEGKVRFGKEVTIDPPLPERTQIIGDMPKVTLTLSVRRRN